MTIRVAINGMGRIGRCIARALIDRSDRYPDIALVAANSPGAPDAQLHLLKYDSVHGRLRSDVAYENGAFRYDGGEIALYHERNPLALPWNDLNVDVLLECSGKFNSRKEAGTHLDAGAKKVIISAPANDADMTVVYGVNHDAYDKKTMRVVSAASCTTNCLAPLAKILHERFVVVAGHMTTVHSYTGDQNLVDATHKDLRRARAAGASIIPTSTGAAKAIGLVLPELEGKLHGASLRVPTPNVSMVDFTFASEKPLSRGDILAALKAAVPMGGALAVCEEPLVSVDFNGSEASCTVDATSIACPSPHLGRVAAWYDNEWGFSLRMLDLVRHVCA
ncbi:MAG: type I glyceraldehyde-3-phosphate dehydrogenase [Rickettsiales bacterium]